MSKIHRYKANIVWPGNTGKGTSGYKDYERSHLVKIEDKVAIACSSDPVFRGNPQLHNPEELLVSAVASCHMLWYLHLCAVAGIVVTNYEDAATGAMVESEDGAGYFSEIVLHPTVVVAEESMAEKAYSLHEEAAKYCFIAKSLKCPVLHQPEIKIAD